MLNNKLHIIIIDTITIKIFYLLKKTFYIIFLILFFVSCENDIKKINIITSKNLYPDEYAKNIEITKTSSGKIISKLSAPEIQVFEKNEKPYTLFPKGLTFIKYDHYPNIELSFSAKYAKYYQNEKLWEARNNVEATNTKGEKINTEQLFRDETKKIFYSNKFTRITSADGIFYGEKGFEADENFTKWKLKNIKNSTVNIKDE